MLALWEIMESQDRIARVHTQNDTFFVNTRFFFVLSLFYRCKKGFLVILDQGCALSFYIYLWFTGSEDRLREMGKQRKCIYTTKCSRMLLGSGVGEKRLSAHHIAVNQRKNENYNSYDCRFLANKNDTWLFTSAL